MGEAEAPPCAVRIERTTGLPDALNAAAAAAAPMHRFLRRQWYAAALAAYGGRAWTLVAWHGDAVAAALPLVPLRRGTGIATVPGCYWPFRSFPVAEGAPPAALDALVATLARRVRALRIGPVYDGDPAVDALVARARAAGWKAISRRIATSFLLDMAAARAEGQWPRASTLKKNRFHEKHLADHGSLEWRFVTDTGWPEAFDMMAAVEKRSWLAERTDGSGDAKFTRWGHGEFFRTAALDPVIAGMFHAAILTIDGRASAFSFDLDTGALKYAIANSYDPAVAKHSPGKLLYYRNLMEAMERGVVRVDWGAGDSGYKRVIGAAEGPAIRDWLLLPPGPAAWCAPLLRRTWR